MIHAEQLCYSEEGVFTETMADIEAFFTGQSAASRSLPITPGGPYELNNHWAPNASYGDTFSLLPQDGYLMATRSHRTPCTWTVSFW